jgi:hypothetical protein
LREALLALRPEIYGNIAEEKVELNGLLYVIERFLGLKNVDLLTLLLMVFKSHFQAIIPQRKRNCYRIDEEQMNVETRGRSDIYDILTHLTFILLNHIKYEIGFYSTMLVKYLVIG